jgi:hypothetical protein
MWDCFSLLCSTNVVDQLYVYLRAWSCMFIHFILFPSPQLCTVTLVYQFLQKLADPIGYLLFFSSVPLSNRVCRGLGQPFYFSSQRAPHLDLGTGQVENQQGGWPKLTYANKQLDSAIKAPSRDWNAEVFWEWSGLGLDGERRLPSGKQHNYGKSQFLIGKSMKIHYKWPF